MGCETSAPSEGEMGRQHVLSKPSNGGPSLAEAFSTTSEEQWGKGKTASMWWLQCMSDWHFACDKAGLAEVGMDYVRSVRVTLHHGEDIIPSTWSIWNIYPQPPLARPFFSLRVRHALMENVALLPQQLRRSLDTTHRPAPTGASWMVSVFRSISSIGAWTEQGFPQRE